MKPVRNRLRDAFLPATYILLLPVPGVSQEIFDPPDRPRVFTAARTTTAIQVDGVLDELDWARAEPVTGFLQKEPQQGAPPSYPTTVRILYDEEALYISAVCVQPKADIRIRNLQRDFTFDDNDVFGIAIDTFMDKRSTVVFQTTPGGNQRDLEVIDGTESNINWDARWIVRTKIRPDEWTAEVAIPWRILRYPVDINRIGIIFSRNIRALNEQLSAPAVPRALSIHHMAYEAELRDVAAPKPHKNIQITPYTLHTLKDTSTGDRIERTEIGGDAKWAFTSNTVLDVTVNTDFAQADVDRAVVNLERFSVFFPERRHFFLENASIFNASVTEWISPFFSRRIGLDRFGSPIPLDGGLRLTSRSSQHQLGVLYMRQGETERSPTADFGVARYVRNLSAQSRVGGMVTMREDRAFGDVGSNGNMTFTVDGLWRPSQSTGLQAMISASVDDALGDGLGAQLWGYYRDNRLYLSTLQYFSNDYEPGMGLELLDTNYIMHNVTAGLDLRHSWLPDSVRSVNPSASAFAFRDPDSGDLLFGYAPVRPLDIRFHSGARISATVEPNWQRLQSSFAPAGIEIAPGNYDFMRYQVSARTDQSATLSGSASVEAGDYFDGKLTSYTLSARYVPTSKVELATDFQIDRLRELGVAAQSKDARLYRVNARLAANPRMQLNGYYERETLSGRNTWNIRFAWEYRPLSYLYFVYNSSRSGSAATSDNNDEDQVILKFTYMLDT